MKFLQNRNQHDTPNPERTCPVCNLRYVPEIAQLPDYLPKWVEWQVDRKLIQDVWPASKGFTQEQREQIISGVCSDKCWTMLWDDKPDAIDELPINPT